MIEQTCEQTCEQKQVTIQTTSDGTPILNDEDIDNVKKRYPQNSHENINYAFACGTASYILLQANKVEGYKLKDINPIEDRNHKDIELFAFNNYFKYLNPNPLDVCGYTYYGPIKQCNYNILDYYKYGIFVEMLNNFYFDYVVPTKDDITVATIKRKKFNVIKPEFLIASKIFNSDGIREGTDDFDTKALLKKFDINYKYLREIIKKSDFNKIWPFQIINLDDEMDNDLFPTIKNKIIDLYKDVCPFIKKLDYNHLTTLLKFEPESLKLFYKNKQHKYRYMKKFDNPKQNNLYNLSSFYLKDHMLKNDRVEALYDGRIKELASSTNDNGLRAVIAIRQIMDLYKRYLPPDAPNSLMIDRALDVGKQVFGHPFLNVKTAQLKHELERHL
ncbi:hypothetical protein ACFL1H_05600 [Nanoarchaeota archaeon]